MRVACAAVALLGLLPPSGRAFSPPKPSLGSKRNCNDLSCGGRVESRVRSSPIRRADADADEVEAHGGDGAGNRRTDERWKLAAGLLGVATANLHASRALAEGTVGVVAGVVATSLLSDGDPGGPPPGDIPKEAIIELTATPSGAASVVSDKPAPSAPETKPPSAIASVSVEQTKPTASVETAPATSATSTEKVPEVGAVLDEITDQKIEGAKEKAAIVQSKAVELKKGLSPTKLPQTAALEAVALASVTIIAGTVWVGYSFGTEEDTAEGGEGGWQLDTPVPYGLQETTPTYRKPPGMGGEQEKRPKEPQKISVVEAQIVKGTEEKGGAGSSASPAVPKKAAKAVLKGGPVTSPPKAGGGISMANLMKESNAKGKEKEWKFDQPTPYGLQDNLPKYEMPPSLKAKKRASAEAKGKGSAAKAVPASPSSARVDAMKDEASPAVPKKAAAAVLKGGPATSPPKLGEGISMANAMKEAQSAIGLKGTESGGAPAPTKKGVSPKKSFAKSQWKQSSIGGGMMKGGVAPSPGGDASTGGAPAPKLGGSISMANLVKGGVAKGVSEAAPAKKSFSKSQWKQSSGDGGMMKGGAAPSAGGDASTGGAPAPKLSESISMANLVKGAVAKGVSEAAPAKKSFAKSKWGGKGGAVGGSGGMMKGGVAGGAGGAPPKSAPEAASGMLKGKEASAMETGSSSVKEAPKSSASFSPFGGGAMMKGKASAGSGKKAPGFGKGGWMKGKAAATGTSSSAGSGGGMLKGTSSPGTTKGFASMKASYGEMGSATKGSKAESSPSTSGFLSDLQQATVPMDSPPSPPAQPVASAPMQLPIQSPPPPPPQPALPVIPQPPPAASPSTVAAPADRNEATVASRTTTNDRVIPQSIGEFNGSLARDTVRGFGSSPVNTVSASPASPGTPTQNANILDGRSPAGGVQPAPENPPALSVTITDPRTGKTRTISVSSNANG